MSGYHNNRNDHKLDKNKCLIEILLPFGTVVMQSPSLNEQSSPTPRLKNNIWMLPMEEQRWLCVERSAIPHPMAELLELYFSAVYDAADAEDWRQEVHAWLAGDDSVDEERLGHALHQLKWNAQGACFLLIEMPKEADEKTGMEAVQLLAELVDQERAFLAAQPLTGRIAMLWLPHGEERPEQELAAWLHTLSAELFILCRAGLSTSIESDEGWERSVDAVGEAQTLGSSLRQVRNEAKFALEAGKRFRSQEQVHRFERLGLARILHGLPKPIRDEFMQETLNAEAVAALTPELRETVFAFLEHSMQVADTARSLYVHRNTLLYRLERITELTGYDIRQPMHLWTLWLALTLLRSN